MYRLSAIRLQVICVVVSGMFSPCLAQSRVYESNINSRRASGQEVQSERDEQAALFNYYFRKQKLTYETRLDALDEQASVPDWRIPYSAAIHPESAGGLSGVRVSRPAGRRAGVRTGGLFARLRQRSVAPPGTDPRAPRPLFAAPAASGNSPLSLYDRAFNDGRDLANDFEVRRIMTEARGLIFRRMVPGSESWEGYCSGFTASTIRHPEPVRFVDAGSLGGTPGVIFGPSDIKALLSCVYNRTTDDSFLFLAPPSAADGGPNAGTFHLALANYIGRAGCPVGIDRTKGPVVWNNPIYAYKVDSLRDAGESNGVRFKEVQTTITYSNYGQDEQNQTDLDSGARVGNRKQSMSMRYVLALNEDGEIIGGRALSSLGHFLWIPLYAPQARLDGSVQGNPYVDVRKVIALARASALPEVQKKFDRVVIGPRIDPTINDRNQRDNSTEDAAPEGPEA